MAETVRVGVVGLGAVFQLVYLPILARRTDLFRVTALCDLSPSITAHFGDRLGVPAGRRYGRIEELLQAGSLDGVVLLTSGSHGAAAQRVLEAGLPLLCEKPLCYTLAEADTLDGSAPLQLGYMKLYDRAVAEALRRRDELGAPRSLEVVVLHPSMENQVRPLQELLRPRDVSSEVSEALAAETVALLEEALGPAASVFGRLYADVLLGSIVHDLALIRALAADPTGIDHAEIWPVGAWPPSVEISGALPSEARLSIWWHYLEDYPLYREKLSLHAERGTLTLLFPSPYLLHHPTSLTITTVDERGHREARFGSYVEAFEEQLSAFHRMVTEGERPHSGVVEGRADIVTSQRVIRVLGDRHEVEVGGEAAFTS